MIGWKRLFLVSMGFGVGAVSTAALVSIAFFWYHSRPKAAPQWNATAIQGRFGDLTLVAGDQVFTRFTYFLENTTDHDYTLEPAGGVTLMVVLPGKKGLNQDPTFAIRRTTYVPAKQSVSVTIDKAFDYDAPLSRRDKDDLDKLTTFIGRKLTDLDGFVLFDKAHRYMINLPNGWGKKQRLTDTGNVESAPPLR